METMLENVLINIDLCITKPDHIAKMVKGEIVKNLYVSTTDDEEEEND